MIQPKIKRKPNKVSQKIPINFHQYPTYFRSYNLLSFEIVRVLLLIVIIDIILKTYLRSLLKSASELFLPILIFSFKYINCNYHNLSDQSEKKWPKYFMQKKSILMRGRYSLWINLNSERFNFKSNSVRQFLITPYFFEY